MLAIPIQPGTTSRSGNSVVGRERLAVHLVGQQDVVESLGDGERAANVAVVDAAGDHARVEAPTGRTSTALRCDARAFQHLGQSACRATWRRRSLPASTEVPGAGVPCWLAKKLRPLPAHSMNMGRRVRGEPAQLLVGEFGAVAPVARYRRRVAATSWHRSRAWQCGHGRRSARSASCSRDSETASQRISAFVPKLTNHSGGSGFTIGESARVAARATPVGMARDRPATSGRAAPHLSNWLRVSPSECSHCSAHVSRYSSSFSSIEDSFVIRLGTTVLLMVDISISSLLKKVDKAVNRIHVSGHQRGAGPRVRGARRCDWDARRSSESTWHSRRRGGVASRCRPLRAGRAPRGAAGVASGPRSRSSTSFSTATKRRRGSSP